MKSQIETSLVYQATLTPEEYTSAKTLSKTRFKPVMLEEEEISFSVTKKEALILWAIIGSISGPGSDGGSVRHFTDALWDKIDRFLDTGKEELDIDKVLDDLNLQVMLEAGYCDYMNDYNPGE